MIQPHGVFLAADPQTLAISHASDNAGSLIGIEAGSLLGRSLTDVLGSSDPSSVVIGDQRFDVIARRHDDVLFVELEPRIGDEEGALVSIRTVLRSMTEAQTKAELFDRTAHGMRELTGYDRVNVANLHADGHGEVVGAAQADRMESHLDLHFPASNIPDQPSRSYLTKRSRLIVDASAGSVAVLADAGTRDLDLSAADLAAPSARDLELIERLGHVSTFSLSIVRRGTLVGFITCAHPTERRLSYSLREGLEIVADQLSLQLAARDEIERLAQRDVMRQTRAELVAQVADGDDIIDALLHRERTVLDLAPADGAAIHLNGRLDAIGIVTEAPCLERLPEIIGAIEGSGDFSSAALASEHPELASHMPGVAGLLVRRLSSADDFVAWFRRETTYTIEWIEDLTAGAFPTRSTQAIGTGTSAPWVVVEREATELSRAIGAALLNRLRAELADYALRDPLTGLVNRRALLDALDRRLTSGHPVDDLALLFVDIDRFKSINDGFGHAAGDAALVHVALKLQAAARENDIVARLGGDEFVVVIDRVDQAEADRVASRLVSAVQGSPADGSAWRVEASVGVAFAQPDQDAAHLLDAADAAMFRAKLGGRNRASR